MRILLVDTSIPLLNRLSRALKRQGCQAEIAVASTASDAYEELASSPFDVVVFDLFLPDDPGMKFIQILSKDYPMSTPLIYSSDLNPDVEKICRSMGGAFFFRKPDDHEKLIQKILNLENRIS
ncbi:MAG: response regulator [Bacteroidales bacterium]